MQIPDFKFFLQPGHFRDNVGSYDGLFYLAGAISVVSGGFWLLEPMMLKIHNKKKDANELMQIEILKQEQHFGQEESAVKILPSSNGTKTS